MKNTFSSQHKSGGGEGDEDETAEMTKMKMRNSHHGSLPLRLISSNFRVRLPILVVSSVLQEVAGTRNHF